MTNPPALTLRGLRKAYGSRVAVEGLDLTVAPGRIVGVLGPNGSGKTSLLRAMLGLTAFEGEARVLGMDPRTARHRIFEHACYLADVAILPRWARVHQLLAHARDVHPRFDPARAAAFLAASAVPLDARLGQLSKGQAAQVHLALALAIDARLLVLDEPTLGLDMFSRKAFYRTLIEDYFDATKTILIATHQVEEVEGLLTDAAVIQGGRLRWHLSMEGMGERFTRLEVAPGADDAARALGPVEEGTLLGRRWMLFDGVPPAALAPWGHAHPASLTDAVVATCRKPTP